MDRRERLTHTYPSPPPPLVEACTHAQAHTNTHTCTHLLLARGDSFLPVLNTPDAVTVMVDPTDMPSPGTACVELSSCHRSRRKATQHTTSGNHVTRASHLNARHKRNSIVPDTLLLGTAFYLFGLSAGTHTAWTHCGWMRHVRHSGQAAVGRQRHVQQLVLEAGAESPDHGHHDEGPPQREHGATQGGPDGHGPDGGHKLLPQLRAQATARGWAGSGRGVHNDKRCLRR